MKSIFINGYIIDIYRYLILLILISIVRQTSSAVIPDDEASVSLYNANDKITILSGKNFSSTVYQSQTAWLVEFYVSWCGHCQSYVKTYRRIAVDILGWKTVVRIGAINCFADENSDVCEQHNIQGFPTLQFMSPETSFETNKMVQLTASNVENVERQLIEKLDSLHRTDEMWPKFSPVNRATLSDLHNRIASTVKLVLVIVEKRDDYTGRQIMLDFSKYYKELAIFRTTTDGKLWQQFQIEITDIPALFIIHSNHTAEQIHIKWDTDKKTRSRTLFNHAIRSYIREKGSINTYDDSDLDEILLSQKALEDIETMKKEKIEDKVIHHVDNTRKINMIDLETALSYMLRREIPRTRQIQGENYDVLIHWLDVLAKYFPGREPVKNYLKDLLSKISGQVNGITGKEFRRLAEINTPNSYLPNNQIQYEYCKGSLPHFRGYPCALWILFHTLTVSHAQSESKQLNILEVPSAIKNFIKTFFGCRHCSENFMSETSDLHQIDTNDKYAAVIYLWKVHNHVNKRLHGDATEDPQSPKIQFPPKSLCSNCQTNSDTNFDLTNTIDFLLQYYSKDNLDLSSIESLNPSDKHKNNIKSNDQRQDFLEQYSMIEINNESTSKSSLIHSIISIIQRFPFYIFICLIIIIFFARQRYCKLKQKRYTL